MSTYSLDYDEGNRINQKVIELNTMITLIKYIYSNKITDFNIYVLLSILEELGTIIQNELEESLICDEDEEEEE